AGNMALGEDCLAIAGVDELVVYVPQRHFLKEREQAVQKDSRVAPLATYHLAMAQADAGQRAQAATSFAKLADDPDWQPVAKARLAELQEKNTSVEARLRSSISGKLPGNAAPLSIAPRKLTLPLERFADVPLRLVPLAADGRRERTGDLVFGVAD